MIAQASRYDDGIPDLAPADWHAREAAFRRDASDRILRCLANPRRHGHGREPMKVVDLDTGTVHDSARAATEWCGPAASYSGFMAALSAGKPYRGHWFAWHRPDLSDPRKRAREVRARRRDHAHRNAAERVAASGVAGGAGRGEG